LGFTKTLQELVGKVIATLRNSPPQQKKLEEQLKPCVTVVVGLAAIQVQPLR
jgi:hypothetical protein